jgi:hypothetical protein
MLGTWSRAGVLLEFWRSGASSAPDRALESDKVWGALESAGQAEPRDRTHRGAHDAQRASEGIAESEEAVGGRRRANHGSFYSARQSSIKAAPHAHAATPIAAEASEEGERPRSLARGVECDRPTRKLAMLCCNTAAMPLATCHHLTLPTGCPWVSMGVSGSFGVPTFALSSP